MKCINKECPSQGRYERGCVKYLDKDGCVFHSDNPIPSNSIDKKKIAALTQERDTLRGELAMTKNALRLHLNGGYCKKGDSHTNCQFLPCGSNKCVALHIKATKEKI